MNKTKNRRLFILLGIFSIVLGVYLYPKLDGTALYSPHSKYEYRLEFFREGLITYEMNKLGREGWESFTCRKARTENGIWGQECNFKRIIK